LASIVTEIQTSKPFQNTEFFIHISIRISKQKKYHKQTTFFLQGDASGLLLFVGCVCVCVCVNFSVVHLPFRMSLAPLPLKSSNNSLRTGRKPLHVVSKWHISINRQVMRAQMLPKSFLHTLCRTILTYLSFTGPLSTPPLSTLRRDIIIIIIIVNHTTQDGE